MLPIIPETGPPAGDCKYSQQPNAAYTSEQDMLSIQRKSQYVASAIPSLNQVPSVDLAVAVWS